MNAKTRKKIKRLARQRNEIWAKFGNRCAYCGREVFRMEGRRLPLPDDAGTIDHVIPIAVSGASRCNYNGVVLACYRCNYEKGDKFWYAEDSPYYGGSESRTPLDFKVYWYERDENDGLGNVVYGL